MTVETSVVTIEENNTSPANPVSTDVTGTKSTNSLNVPTSRGSRAKAIEISFPVVEISQLAERESYRKEIFRPIYHIHKWWANRLGSVFRGIVLGAISGSNLDIWKEYYKKT